MAVTNGRSRHAEADIQGVLWCLESDSSRQLVLVESVFFYSGVSGMSRWRRSPNLAQAFLIAATLIISYAYFYQGNGWNQNSRFDLTRAIVEQHTILIDDYQENTGDKAFWAGHYYSEKAPALALTAVPVWEAGRMALRAARKDPLSPRSVIAEKYLVTVFTVGLPSAMAAACLFLVALKLGASVNGAGFAALALGLATPFWPYATVFWGHGPAGACLFFAFAVVVALREFDSPRSDLLLGALVGLTAGWATVTEFPAGPAAAILALLALFSAWSDRTRVFRVAIGIAAGALPCILVIMTYNALAFGSPLAFGYSYNVSFGWATKDGIMGVTYPKAHALRELLVGRYRGLLPLAPLVAAAPFGLRLLWKQKDARGSVIAIAALSLYYLLFNASYAAWDGGWCYGPRYMSSALPFLCLPLALLWSRSSLVFRSLLATLALYGVSISLIAVSTNIQPPGYLKSPVQELLWPAFRAGHIPLYYPDRWNLGTLAGLQGLASLLPLFLLWGAASAAWVWLARQSSRSEGIGQVMRGTAVGSAERSDGLFGTDFKARG
jgi:hypothetical protein